MHASAQKQFLGMHYMPGADLRAEFDRIHTRYEELLNIENKISNAEYSSMIIDFLSADLATFISQLSATAKLAKTIYTKSNPSLAMVALPQAPLNEKTPDITLELII
ncbi:hypothetical protein OBBRIDRAFT_840353 [Obba rivulosa]|uniref:Uncharacterized protein n=1 Tax=Obba rivulosa TaxID=1052685 RepID=A0A8E2DEF3_9APHY|nr:hypothetical protein OBBRIDRAFT_840353 [Obba rivulosa]